MWLYQLKTDFLSSILLNSVFSILLFQSNLNIASSVIKYWYKPCDFNKIQ